MNRKGVVKGRKLENISRAGLRIFSTKKPQVPLELKEYLYLLVIVVRCYPAGSLTFKGENTYSRWYGSTDSKPVYVPLGDKSI